VIVDGNLPQGLTEDLLMQIPAFKEQYRLGRREAGQAVEHVQGAYPALECLPPGQCWN
jgi:hypothetical protein